MAIRYDDRLNRILNKAVKNYNAKITRLEGVDAELLPNRASVRELKRTFTDRRQLLREIESLKRFTKRGAERIVEAPSGQWFTAYELGEIKRQQATARRLATLKVNQQIQRLGSTTPRFPVMQNSTLNTLKAQAQILKKYDVTTARGAEYRRHMQRIEQQLTTKRRNQTFYNNFFTVLLSQSRLAGYDKDKMTELENRLRDLSPNELLELSQNDPAISVILYSYGKEGQKVTTEDQEEIITYTDYLYNNMDRIIAEYKS